MAERERESILAVARHVGVFREAQAVVGEAYPESWLERAHG